MLYSRKKLLPHACSNFSSQFIQLDSDYTISVSTDPIDRGTNTNESKFSIYSFKIQTIFPEVVDWPFLFAYSSCGTSNISLIIVIAAIVFLLSVSYVFSVHWVEETKTTTTTTRKREYIFIFTFLFVLWEPIYNTTCDFRFEYKYWFSMPVARMRFVSGTMWMLCT